MQLRAPVALIARGGLLQCETRVGAGPVPMRGAAYSDSYRGMRMLCCIGQLGVPGQHPNKVSHLKTHLVCGGGIPWRAGIARWARPVRREFRRHRLAEHHCASRFRERHRRGMHARSEVLVDRRAVCRGHGCGVHEVLHADGKTLERAIAVRIDLARVGQGAFRVNMLPRTESPSPMRTRLARTRASALVCPLDAAATRARIGKSRKFSICRAVEGLLRATPFKVIKRHVRPL